MLTTTTTKKPRNPELRTHKQSGRQFATFNGRKVWFGHKSEPTTKPSFEAYRARWVLNGYRDLDGTGDGAAAELTVRELAERYREHLARLRPAVWFEKNGPRLTRSLDPLLAIFGDDPAADFGPKALRTVRQAMLADGALCREELNARVGIIKAAFVWAGADELVPASVAHGVALVKGLRAGDYGAREGKGSREPVDEAHVEATLPHLHPIAAALVRLLHVTGARPSELFNLAPASIDRSGDVWSAEIVEHKTARHGHERELVFGPKAQAILLPFLDRVPAPAPGSPIFSPAGAVPREDREARGSRKIGDRYTAGALRVAITRAVSRANRGLAVKAFAAFVKQNGTDGGRRFLREHFKVDRVSKLRGKRLAECVRKLNGPDGVQPVPEWTPYQLRHTCLSNIRRGFGIEAAAAIGGHALSKESRITEHYTGSAQRDLAREVARKAG
jgi:integrase